MKESMMDAILRGEKVNMMIGGASLPKPIQSMVDGSLHTDLRAYERHVKESGYEIVGNDSSIYRNQQGQDVREVVAAQKEKDLCQKKELRSSSHPKKKSKK